MKTIVSAIFACLTAASALNAEVTWVQGLPQATDQATRENKLILLDFTGSDWCGWCKRLDAETFSQPQFADYADKNVVMVEVDFPSHKAQSADLHEINSQLKKQYNVSGFPTLILLNTSGTVLWKQVGYLAGGPAAMISQIAKFRPGSAAPAPASTAAAPASAPGAPRPIIYPAPPPRVPGDEPKLQAILYSSAHPSSVMLDGKSCEEGEAVHGMRVLKIARDKVTVQWHGETKELTMK